MNRLKPSALCDFGDNLYSGSWSKWNLLEALAEQDCFWCWSSASKTVNAHCHTRRCMYHMLECRSENCKLSCFMPAPLPPPHLRWNLEGSDFSYSSSHVWSPHFPLNGIRLDQSAWLVPVFIVSSTVVMDIHIYLRFVRHSTEYAAVN